MSFASNAAKSTIKHANRKLNSFATPTRVARKFYSVEARALPTIQDLSPRSRAYSLSSSQMAMDNNQRQREQLATGLAKLQELRDTGNLLWDRDSTGAIRPTIVESNSLAPP